jgi:hypothetical protein
MTQEGVQSSIIRTVMTSQTVADVFRTHRGLMNSIILHSILVSRSSLWAQLPRRQVAYRYMNCGLLDILGINFLVA